jgi:glyoxylase-like metal-dependent hydrolase (beta-lactamase superfamily II)
MVIPSVTVRVLIASGVLTTTTVLTTLSAAVAPAARQTTGVPTASGALAIEQVTPDVYLIAGAGSNVTVNVGAQGLFVVDSGSEAMSAETVAAIRRISPKPIRYLVNTSADADHTGGNPAVDKLGAMIPTRELVEEGAVIIAHENVLNRMSAPTGKVAPTPLAAWPTATFFVPMKDLYFNNQPIQLMHQPAAHTDGDVIVWLRKSDVIATGDIFDKTRYPVIDLARGGSVTGLIDALNKLLDLVVSGEKAEGGTMVVPGHGRICDEADVVDYRDMVTIVRDRIQSLMKKGMTLAQIKAARPTRDFDLEYVKTGGPTGEQFIEAVFRSLSGTKN